MPIHSSKDTGTRGPLRRMTVGAHHECPAVGVPELDGHVSRGEPELKEGAILISPEAGLEGGVPVADPV